VTKRRQYGSIRKLPSGRYQARRWQLGEQVGAPDTFATKAEAHAWLSAVETDIERGDYVDPALGDVKFGVYATRWMDERAGLRPHTRETYQSQLRSILDGFEHVPLNRIDGSAVRSWHAALSRSGRHPNTVAKIYRLFRTMLSTAVDDGLLRANPCRLRGAAAESIVERPNLSTTQVAQLADAIPPRFHALVWTAALSGLRFGELTGLARRHVDIEGRTLTVQGALGFVKGTGAVLGPPKTTASYRKVVLPAVGAAYLRDHIERFVEPGPDAFIFTSLTGKPLLNQYFGSFWRTARSSVGLDEIRFHDLRHFAGTMAATSGASFKEIKARMGHASNDSAVRYLKAGEGRDREVADAIDRRLAHDLSPRT